MGVNGLNSIRATFLRTTVSVAMDPTDQDDTSPVGAIRVYTDPCGIACDNIRLYPSTGLSRASFWLSPLEPNEDAAPPPIEFQIRQAVGPNAEIVYAGTFAANKFHVQGLIAEIAGPVCEQFEFYARVPFSPNAIRHAMTITVTVITDRLPSTGILLPNGAFLKKGVFTL